MVYQPDPERGGADQPGRAAKGGPSAASSKTGGNGGSTPPTSTATRPNGATTPPGVDAARGAEQAAARGATFADRRRGAVRGAVREPRQRAASGPTCGCPRRSNRRRQIAGVRAFLYTGPRVTTGEGHGGLRRSPTRREFARYAELLSGPLPSFPVTSPRATDARPGNECEFHEAFGGFPRPLGGGAPRCRPARRREVHGDRYGRTVRHLLRAGARPARPGGEPVRVIVLDDSATGARTWAHEQLQWLAQRARTKPRTTSEPAIVVGNADLNAQIAGGDQPRRRLRKRSW